MRNFHEWNTQKQFLEHRTRIPFFREREIWWCSLGVNVGHEEDGKHVLFERPVLIIKKFNQASAWVVPLSSREKYGQYYYRFTVNEKSNIALLSQLRLVSAKRFSRRFGVVPSDIFSDVVRKIISILQKVNGAREGSAGCHEGT